MVGTSADRLLLVVLVRDDMDDMEEDGVGLVRRGRRRECEHSEIRIKERVGWRRGRSVDVH